MTTPVHARFSRRLRAVALTSLAALALFGAACTDGDDDPTPAPSPTPTATSEGTPTPAGTTTPTPTPVMTETPTPTVVVTPTAAPADGCAALDPRAEEASFVFVANVTSGAELTSGATVMGCSRTFESNVTWRLLDREGNVLADGFTMGGGVDGHAPFEFQVSYTVAEAQVGHLFVEAPDPSDGEGFPPVVNQIPVILAP